MPEADTEILETTARNYDRFLVPSVFQPFARLIADEATTDLSRTMLDVACGTGVLAQELANRCGKPHNITGFDANSGMLAVARLKNPDINWQQGDVTSLPFERGSFDVVTCQFALMLFDDKKKALQEMWRVLDENGKLVIAVFDNLPRNPAYEMIANIYEEHAGVAVANALRYPFSLGRIADLKALFSETGIDLAGFQTVKISATFGSALKLAHSDILGWFPFAGLTLSDTQIAKIAAGLKHAFGDTQERGAPLSFDVHAHILTAVKGRR